MTRPTPGLESLTLTLTSTGTADLNDPFPTGERERAHFNQSKARRCIAADDYIL